MIQSRQHRRDGAFLVRHGQVVESGGATVVRFPGGCDASADTDARPAGCGSVCCCRVSAGFRDIPLAWLDAPQQYQPGERLLLEVSATALTRAAAALFGLPLAALLLGAWAGGAAAAVPGWPADIAGGFAGLVCLALTSIILAGNGGAVVGMLKLTVRRPRTVS